MPTTAEKTKKRVVPPTIGERVQEARDALGINQSELARRIGVSRAAVTQWENGRTKDIKMKHVEALSRVLQVSKEYLTHGKEGGKLELSDEAVELAYAWDAMPDGEWKQRVFYFVTTFKMLGRQYQGEQQLNQAKHLYRSKKSRGRNH